MLRLGTSTSAYFVLMIVLASGLACAQAGHEKEYVVFEHATLENLPSTQIPKSLNSVPRPLQPHRRLSDCSKIRKFAFPPCTHLRRSAPMPIRRRCK